MRSLIVLVLAGTVAGQDCVGLADTAASGPGETSMSSLPMYHTLHQLPLSSYAWVDYLPAFPASPPFCTDIGWTNGSTWDRGLAPCEGDAVCVEASG